MFDVVEVLGVSVVSPVAGAWQSESREAVFPERVTVRLSLTENQKSLFPCESLATIKAGF